jgi:hypothetical protein
MKTLRAAGLYLVLTIVLTWPLVTHLRVTDAGDSAFFAWEIGWTVHALATEPAQLPHGNIFHPLRYTLGLDEPILGTTLLVLPLAVFTQDAVLLHNVLRLLTFLVSALAAYWLARELGTGEALALLAGAFFAFSPIRTDQMIAHLSTLGTQWWPLVLLFTIRFARVGRARDALLAALFFVLAFLACGYHGVIAIAVLPPTLGVLFWGRWRRLPAASLAAALAALALLPVYLMHRRALAPERYLRTEAETVLYSAPLESFLATSRANRVYGEATDAFRAAGANDLFPGLVVPGLVIAGAVTLARRRERPSREALALAVLLCAAALVALGPRIRAFGHDFGPGPWALLRAALPLFQMIRVSSRAGVFVALPLVMLAALALRRLRPGPVLLGVLAFLGMAETLVAPIAIAPWSELVDTRKEPPPVYRWLAGRPGRDAIVELPMLDGYGLARRPAFHESVYMLYSTLHWKPLLNGYAGIEPAAHARLRELLRGFPSAESLAALRASGARYVIVHRKGYGPYQWQRLEAGLPQALAGPLQEVAEFGPDFVYDLRPVAAE